MLLIGSKRRDVRMYRYTLIYLLMVYINVNYFYKRFIIYTSILFLFKHYAGLIQVTLLLNKTHTI